MPKKSDVITINKLKKLGFYFKDTYEFRYTEKYFNENRSFIKEYPIEENTAPDRERFFMYYNLCKKYSKSDEYETIVFEFESPILTDDEDCTVHYSHLEMHAFEHTDEENRWVKAEVYNPKNMRTVELFIELWNSTSRNYNKCKKI